MFTLAVAAVAAERAWYEHPLAIALVSVVSTLLATQVGGFLERRILSRQRAKSLRMAFCSEVQPIQRQLRLALSVQVQKGDDYVIWHRKWHTDIYKANASHLGDLNDPVDVGLIVELYGILEALDDVKAEYHRSETVPEGETDSLYVFKMREAAEQLPGHYMEGIRNAHLKASLLLLFISDPKDRNPELVAQANWALGQANGPTLGTIFTKGKKLLLRANATTWNAMMPEPQNDGSPIRVSH